MFDKKDKKKIIYKIELVKYKPFWEGHAISDNFYWLRHSDNLTYAESIKKMKN